MSTQQRVHVFYTRPLYLIANELVKWYKSSWWPAICYLTITVPWDGNTKSLDDPRMSHQLSNSDATSRVHLHQVMKQINSVDTQPLGNGKPTRLDLAINDGHVVGRVVKWQTTTHQCVQQHAHTPHVYLLETFTHSSQCCIVGLIQSINQSKFFNTGLSSNDYHHIHWRRLANMQEGPAARFTNILR